MWYCVAYTTCHGLAVWQYTFALAGTNNTTAIFQAKFGWNKDEVIFYNTIISSAGLVGIMIGSVLAGRILSIGRLRSVIISQLMAIIASGVSMVTHTATLTVARLILGISASLVNVGFGKMINETIPEHIYAKFAMV